MLALKAQTRNSGAARKEGEIPAVFYGAGKENTAISISLIDFKKIWHKAGESSTVKIEVEGGKAVDTLIHEVQTNPVTDEPIHVDFLAIDINKPIKVNIPVEFEGISEAVKNNLGTLVKVLHEVEVEALPKDLPHNFVVDISALVTVDDQILVSVLKLPAGVTMVTGPEEVIASIALQKEEPVEEAPVDLSAIEVEKKGKKEEEGAGEEAATAAGEEEK